jgi:competence ComEA-like helix-hairpin-helix protein
MQRKMRFDKPRYFNVYKCYLNSLFLLSALVMMSGCERQKTAQNFATDNKISPSENAVNINIASAEELEKLPHVGKETAKKIVAFRETYGKFRRTENLILVVGISDKKFREMKSLVKVE